MATGVVLVVVAWVKFMHGAWIILVAVPLFVAGMAAIRRHYLWVASRLRQVHPTAVDPSVQHRVVVLASRSGRHLDQALHFARLLHPDRLETWHVEEPGDLRLLAQWNQRHADTPLRFLEAGPDGVAGTLRRQVRRVREADPGSFLTVVVAEEVRARRWRHLIAHRNGGLSILWGLRQESGVAVTDLNYSPARRGGYRPEPASLLTLVSKRLVRMAGTSLDFGRERAGIVRRVEAIVLISEVTAPTLRAVQYACAVCPGAVRALHVEIEPEQRARVEAAWAQHRVEVPLEVVESPYPGPHHGRGGVPGAGDAALRQRHPAQCDHPGVRGRLPGGEAAPQPVGPVDSGRPLRPPAGGGHLGAVGARRALLPTVRLLPAEPAVKGASGTSCPASRARQDSRPGLPAGIR